MGGMQQALIAEKIASGVVTFSSSFTGGAQAPISTPWVSPVGGSSQCNQTAGAHLEGEGSNALAVLGSPTFPANQKTTITLDATASMGPGVRFSTSAFTGYVCYIFTGHVAVLKYTSISSNTQVGSDITISSQNAGDTVSLSATGTSSVTLSVYVNGVLQGSVTDSSSTITSGQPAFYANGFGDITKFDATSL